MTEALTILVRDAELPQDVEAIERLWFEYLTWGNEEMQARHGVHPHSPRETVAQDIASIAKFQPPEGRLVLAFREGRACGIGCLRRIGADTAEIKRMYVDPAVRRTGAGRAILEYLLTAATSAGYLRARLDSPRFMTAAHALYRSAGFVDIEPYAESEIPDSFKPFLLFMERDLRPTGAG
jgi:GNAT superfamily N-acetyltransferase